MKSLLTIVLLSLLMGLPFGLALAHDGGRVHNRAQGFSFDYNSEHDVYCGWRHSYEGISCVKVGD